MTRRLYLAPSTLAAAEPSGELQLPREAAHYLRSVLRLRSQDNIEAFTGDGRYSHGTVSHVGKHNVTLSLQEWQHSPAPELELHLACAVLKNQAMDRVMQKATELGASVIYPLYTQHTQVPNAARKNPQTRLEHWQRIVENAAEQCGQNYLPKLCTPIDLADFLQDIPTAQALVLAIGAAPFPATLSSGPTLIMSGPEGGWSQHEIDLMQQHHVQPASFGSLVLRAETAPLVGLVSAHQALIANG